MNETIVKMKTGQAILPSPIRRIKKNGQARIIRSEELATLRYPLPESLLKAAGLLKNRRKALERHLKKVGGEWDRKSA